MKSTVEQLSPTRVKINVEVPFDELKPDFDRAYKKIAQQVNIPGFRPGRAPARILDQRLGRGAVLEEVINGAVPAKFAEIVSAGEVHPIGRPDYEVTKIEDGDHVAFTAEVDVRPQIDMPAFGEIAVSVDNLEVTEAEVDEELDGLRSRFGTLLAVERPVQQKDFVVLDLSATVDGEEIAGSAVSDLSYQVGSGELIDGIDDALLGAAQGDEPTFTTTWGVGEHVGRQVEVTVTIKAVKEKELPAADDEFAQMASEFDTLEELRGDLLTRLGRVKALQQSAQARDEVLKALLAATEVPLPEAIVDSAYESSKHDAVHAFDHDEQRLNHWLEQQGRDPAEFDADLRKGAQETVKAQLLLDAIADAEELSATENELTERIVYLAHRHGMSPNEYALKIRESGGIGVIEDDVRRGKALNAVVRQASVTDASGNSVDIDALIDAATAR